MISVTEHTGIDEVRHLLVDRRIRRVPVLAGGRLVGIVSRSDVVALDGDGVGVPGLRRAGPRRAPARACPKCLGGAERFVLQEQPPGA